MSCVFTRADGAKERLSSVGGVAGPYATAARNARRPPAWRACEGRDASIGNRRKGALIIGTPSDADDADGAWGITIPKS